ncbi:MULTISPECIES: GNAT family N-acetyltransferase [Methylophaga]|uniref:GNAT family N-acetyltransferase n=1 Tax=Methylophaga TaxID=40222 RepID=UPI00235533F4|nr:MULTISPECIES: GNAT family N-acetyltransferase [Methylophaga]
MSFRLATDHDVETIHLWLLEHDRREVHGSFLCNWSSTQRVHDENQLFVATLDDEAIAYIWGDFGILEVREDFRKKGVGKQLVEYAMQRVISTGKIAVSIECEPESSIPFWEKMGFEFHNKNKASYVFEKSLDIPAEGSPVTVEIMFYPEHAKWTPETLPIKSYSPTAVLDNQGIIHLQNRVAAYVRSDNYNGDAIIKICVDGEPVYFDKAKYSEAMAIGVTYNSGVFYIDKLHHKVLPRTNHKLL